MSERIPLPDLWWVQGQQYMPQSYACPLLMTLSIWWLRLRHRENAHWYGGQWNWDRWESPARVLIRSRFGVYREASCIFPRWLILKECDFWNSRTGGRLRAPRWPFAHRST